jgi:hypothetical protein
MIVFAPLHWQSALKQNNGTRVANWPKRKALGHERSWRSVSVNAGESLLIKTIDPFGDLK